MEPGTGGRTAREERETAGNEKKEKEQNSKGKQTNNPEVTSYERWLRNITHWCVTITEQRRQVPEELCSRREERRSLHRIGVDCMRLVSSTRPRAGNLS